MSRDLKIILILLIVNLIVALVYLILHLRKKDRKKGLINFVTFLVFPLVGFLYMGLSELINLILYRRNKKEIRYEDLSFEKTRMKLAQDPDVERSMDKVPLEEAMIMSGKAERRRSMMDVLKRDDYTEMMDQIKEAVSSEDMEISHYAAAFVSDTITRYKNREQELRNRMEKNPTSENRRGYVLYLQDIVESDLFADPDADRYLDFLDRAARQLYEEDRESFPDHTAAVLLKRLSDSADAKRAGFWIRTIREKSMVSLECFKTYAEYCFAAGDREAFFAHLRSVRNSSVTLDNEALEWIRFFAS